MSENSQRSAFQAGNDFTIVIVHVDEIGIDSRMRLAYAPDSSERQEAISRISSVPCMVVDQNKTLVFGYDILLYLQKKNQAEVQVLQAHLSHTDALFLNFNLINTYFAANLYEKICFISKALPLVPVKDIYRKTGLNLKISDSLRQFLPILLTPGFKKLLCSNRIPLQSALEICRYPEADRSDLTCLLAQISFTASQTRQLIEMSREICFREKISCKSLFRETGTISEAEAPPNAAGILAALFKRRFPLLSEYEKNWQQQIRELQLPDNLRVSHFPNFEKEEMEINLRVSDMSELKKIARRLSD